MDKIIFLEPIFFERIWGGDNLKEFNFDIPKGNIGEAWVIAAHKNGSSIIKNGLFAGKTLKDAYSLAPTLFTQKIYNKFPLLIKILDAKEDLSVQVHPNDNYAALNENGELGKTECWYVLDSKEDAKLIYGHTARSKAEFNELINEEKWDKLLIEKKTKKDDFYYIPAGTLHAIGAGNLIYEVQQNSDTTYRTYDYNRKDKNGKPRELHIEKTKDVTTIPFTEYKNQEQIFSTDDATITLLVEENYFGVYKIVVNGTSYLEKNKTGNLLTVLDGSGEIIIDSISYKLKKGDSFILTTSCNNFTLQGNMFLIGSYDR